MPISSILSITNCHTGIIWKMAPDCTKKSNSLKEFKLEINLWESDNCPCRLCKEFLPQVGFLYVF